MKTKMKIKMKTSAFNLSLEQKNERIMATNHNETDGI